MFSMSHWHVCACHTYDTLIYLKQGICPKKSVNGIFMFIVNEIRGNADLNSMLRIFSTAVSFQIK